MCEWHGEAISEKALLSDCAVRCGRLRTSFCSRSADAESLSLIAPLLRKFCRRKAEQSGPKIKQISKKISFCMKFI